MVDPTPGTSSDESRDDPGHPSEEEARAFVEQLRSAPAEQIVAEVLSTFLTAAEVKLGRRDARLFIDLCAAVSRHAAPYVSDELAKQVEQALGQLRLGQVSAESHRGEQDEPEPNDLTRTPTPPATDAQTRGVGDAPAESPASRLWIPGR